LNANLTSAALAALLGLFAVVGGAEGAASASEQAGVSAAVRGQVQRASDAEPVGVQVVSGQPIYLADRISSGAQSGMQIMLLDQTTFTIGPDSFVKIDEFVYDPATNVGKVTASLGKGVFRFVSGKIAQQNPSNMTVKLPVATIGIRGTMVYGRSDENSAVVGLAGAGPDNNTGDKPAGIDVTTPQGTAEVRRPGWGVNVERGQAPVVQKLPKPLVDAILNSVAPRDLVNAISLPTGAANAAQASRPANVNTANNSSGQSTASAAPNMQTFKTGQNQQQNYQRIGQTTITSPGGNGSGGSSGSGSSGEGFNPSGLTLYSDLRTIATGTGTFVANNVPILLNSTQIGSYNFLLTINFGTQSLSASFVETTSGAIVSSSTININQSYGSLSGAATGSTGQSCGAGAISCGAAFDLLNAGGIVAKEASHAVAVTNGSQTAIGQAVTTRP
jgi:hypothetical protein